MVEEEVVVVEVGLRIESKARGAAVARRLTGLRMVFKIVQYSDGKVCLVLIFGMMCYTDGMYVPIL